MEQSGEQTIEAKQVEVWNALHDPSVLQSCLEGCESMELTDDGTYRAIVLAKIGPVRAKFNAIVRLENEVPPTSYTLLVEVEGKGAGFGKGSANISLSTQGDSTLLSYVVKGDLGGRLAQVGSRLVVSASRKMADRFFASFAKLWTKSEPKPIN